MSKVDEILEDFGASISPVVVMGAPNKNPYVKPMHLQNASQKIKELLLSEADTYCTHNHIMRGDEPTKPYVLAIPIEAIEKLFRSD